MKPRNLPLETPTCRGFPVMPVPYLGMLRHPCRFLAFWDIADRFLAFSDVPTVFWLYGTFLSFGFSRTSRPFSDFMGRSSHLVTFPENSPRVRL
ncbi:hypothetical protein Taro_023670 [Colocasia esculenta]|uniref:Uncharacterized protein n=1 Tax=Colocasia esculenta TaxID=4460 RepID=A0A843V746_COLES|nr:hypothetical protein [Colocasia esculenta]